MGRNLRSRIAPGEVREYENRECDKQGDEIWIWNKPETKVCGCHVETRNTGRGKKRKRSKCDG